MMITLAILMMKDIIIMTMMAMVMVVVVFVAPVSPSTALII